MSRSLILACYDIHHPKALRQALTATRAFATAGQYSAYECFLTRTERRVLKTQLRAIIAPTDVAALIRPDLRREVLTAGVARAPEDPHFFLID